MTNYLDIHGTIEQYRATGLLKSSYLKILTSSNKPRPIKVKISQNIS